MQEGVVCVIIVSYDYWLLFTYHYSARCLKNVFRKMCVMICENDFSNTPEEKQT